MSHKTHIKTGRKDLDDLVLLIGSFLCKDVLELTIDGKPISGFRTPDAKSLWIRDHSDMLRGGRYFHPDVTSAVEHFAETQSASGRIFDYFTTFPEKLPCERENWTKYVRVPVEADVEYRFVKGAYHAWQASGDDEWMNRMLPVMAKALQYIQCHDWYWDDMHGLVKRAYTIDTWDFAYSAGTHDWLQFQINEHTFWGIMHGDNSGYYEAFRIMAYLYDRFGDRDRTEHWKQQADTLRANMNAACWNGNFYTHFVKLNPVAIIEEYQRRRRCTNAFAEWFSIDPPFPDGIFGDEKLIGGAYVNGGIMPLVGGELAKAALDHGFEEYGVDILTRYHSLISEKQETYLWYFPDGTPASVEASTSPEAEPTDGWGSSAMLYALTDGLAGVEDLGKGFDEIRLSPRWPAAQVDNAEVGLTYESLRMHLGYDYRLSSSGIKMNVSCPKTVARFHILLPSGVQASAVTVAGEELAYEAVQIRKSHYVDFTAHVRGEVEVAISFS
jgi:hypothetical protein